MNAIGAQRGVPRHGTAGLGKHTNRASLLELQRSSGLPRALETSRYPEVLQSPLDLQLPRIGPCETRCGERVDHREIETRHIDQQDTARVVPQAQRAL